MSKKEGKFANLMNRAYTQLFPSKKEETENELINEAQVEASDNSQNQKQQSKETMANTEAAEGENMQNLDEPESSEGKIVDKNINEHEANEVQAYDDVTSPIEETQDKVQNNNTAATNNSIEETQSEIQDNNDIIDNDGTKETTSEIENDNSNKTISGIIEDEKVSLKKPTDNCIYDEGEVVVNASLDSKDVDIAKDIADTEIKEKDETKDKDVTDSLYEVNEEPDLEDNLNYAFKVAAQQLLEITEEYKRNKNIKPDKFIAEMLQNRLEEVMPIIDKGLGSTQYTDEIKYNIGLGNSIDNLNEPYKDSKDYILLEDNIKSRKVVSRLTGIYESLNRNKPKLCPIENIFLKQYKDDILVDYYLKILGLILQQAHEIETSQAFTYKRMVDGTNVTDTSKYDLTESIDIKAEDCNIFIDKIKNPPLKYRFILDSMILTATSERNEEQMNLIAEFCEALEITFDEASYLTNMAEAILENNKYKYVDLNENCLETIPEAIFYDYVKLLTEEYILVGENMAIFQGDNSKEVSTDDLEKIYEVNAPIIKFINVKVDLDEYSLYFFDKDKIIFEGCTFKGGNTYPIMIDRCDNIIIKNCKFENFTARTLKIKSVKRMEITQSYFINCLYRSNTFVGDESYTKLGGVIYSDEPYKNGMVILSNCTFDNCLENEKQTYNRNEYISNCHSKFIKCRYYIPTKDNGITKGTEYSKNMFSEMKEVQNYEITSDYRFY